MTVYIADLKYRLTPVVLTALKDCREHGQVALAEFVATRVSYFLSTTPPEPIPVPDDGALRSEAIAAVMALVKAAPVIIEKPSLAEIERRIDAGEDISMTPAGEVTIPGPTPTTNVVAIVDAVLSVAALRRTVPGVITDEAVTRACKAFYAAIKRNYIAEGGQENTVSVATGMRAALEAVSTAPAPLGDDMLREIERLNGIYKSAVKGRADFRTALVRERENALRWPVQAEGIALIIAENAEPKPENIPYLAVKIAEAVQTGNY